MRRFLIIVGALAALGSVAGAKTDDVQASKATVADIRHIGDAVTSWLADRVPPGSFDAPVLERLDWAGCPAVSYDEVTRLLIPKYAMELPRVDGWGNPLQFCLQSDRSTPTQYKLGIRSPGQDGRFESNIYQKGPFLVSNFGNDVVWFNGFFIRWPQLHPALQTIVWDVRNLGEAMSSWAADTIKAPGDYFHLQHKTVHWPSCPPASYAEVRRRLVPDYIHEVPKNDGWGNPYEFCLRQSGFTKSGYALGIRSPGRGGAFEKADYVTGDFDPTYPENDIVWLDGFFIRWPKR